MVNKICLLNLKDKVIDYINNQNLNQQEICNWLSDNQNYNSHSIFLLRFLIFMELKQVKIILRYLIYSLMHQNEIIYWHNILLIPVIDINMGL
jgi:hypothetical protein